ncbi:hypothetical protein MKX01_010125 [Papaver californicum]|nr:hypothetical protein MKX01_010125 [Papaver californicum]
MGLVTISHPSSISSHLISPSLLRTSTSLSSFHRFSRRTSISSLQWLNQSSSSFTYTTRVNNSSTRCSTAIADVHINHVAAEDEAQDDSPSSIPSGSSIPIVSFRPEILETESLSLLTEAKIHPSLLPVAVVGFFTELAIFVAGPLVGKLMDHFPRVPAYNCFSTVQAAAQLLSVAMIIRAHTVTSIPAASLLLKPWFCVLVLAGAVERLSGLALGVAMERDWVVRLAGTNRPIALSQANAIISRIDLLYEIAGASLFGILLSKYDSVTCLKLAAVSMICSVPVVVFLMWLSNKLSAGVLDRAKSPQAWNKSFSEVPLPIHGNLVEIDVDAIKHGWIEYKQQPVLPARVSGSIIGGFSGLCAFMGVAATFISASLVKRLGILKAGAAGLIFQASLLTVAVAVYWSSSLSQKTPLFFFLSLIVLSRLGNMSYHVLGAQILQTGIPSSKSNIIGTTEPWSQV